MKVTIIGKPEDFIRQSRPEDVLKYAKPEPKAVEEDEKDLSEPDLDFDDR